MRTDLRRKIVALVVTAAFWLACAAALSSAQNGSGDVPRDLLLRALRAKLSAKSYRSKFLQSDTAGQNITVDTEYVAPDKYRMIAATNLARKDRSPVEVIMIGGESFTKGFGGEWQRSKISPEEARSDRTRQDLLIKNLAAAKESAVTYAGSESLGGKEYRLYRYVGGVAPGTPGRGRSTTWVDAVDGLPSKVEIETEMTVEGRTMRITQTTTYRDYNADIEIAAPLQ